jgi:beta-N-acetylhexosaminidase
MTEQDPHVARGLEAVHFAASRRRFLKRLGLGLGAVAFEAAGGTLLRATLGERIGAPQTAAAAEARRLAAVGKRAGLPAVIGVERLAPAPMPARKPQPGQPASFRPELRQRIAQMLLVGFRGTSVDASSPIVADIAQRSLGGVVLFDGRNITSPTQLVNLTATLQSASQASTVAAKLIVAVDEEGGNVARLSPRNGFPGTYSAATLGARNDAAFTQAQGTAIAQTLASVGVNLNLAPVVDLNLNRANRAIGGNGRSFSGDANIAAAQAAAFITGHHAVGVRTVLKHFPGQGSAGGDTHVGFVDVTPNWTDYELQPFVSLMGQGLVDAIMTGHIFNARLDPIYPATLSYATITGLLREQLGYGGVVVSDDLNMAAIRLRYRYEDVLALAIGAGVDLLTIAEPSSTDLVTRTIDIIEAHVANGALTEARIDASYDRIVALKSLLPGG